MPSRPSPTSPPSRTRPPLTPPRPSLPSCSSHARPPSSSSSPSPGRAAAPRQRRRGTFVIRAPPVNRNCSCGGRCRNPSARFLGPHRAERAARCEGGGRPGGRGRGAGGGAARPVEAARPGERGRASEREKVMRWVGFVSSFVLHALLTSPAAPRSPRARVRNKSTASDLTGWEGRAARAAAPTPAQAPAVGHLVDSPNVARNVDNPPHPRTPAQGGGDFGVQAGTRRVDDGDE